MSNKKNIDDYFDDNFEVTYTEDLPPLHMGQNDSDNHYDDYRDSNRHPGRSYNRNRRYAPDDADDYDDDYDDTDYLDEDDGYEDTGYLDDYENNDYDETDYLDSDYDDDDSYDRHRPPRQTSRKNSRRRSDSSEELAAPIRNIARTGSTAAEKLTNFILRPAPVLMSAIILAITFFSFWNQMSDYGDIQTLSSNPDLTLIAYLAIGAVMLIWMLSTFFFTLSGIWHGTGRGLTYFILVYILSYLFSLAANAIPADIDLLTGVRGGILVFGSLYPVYFPFCVVGMITCILRKVLK